LASCVDMYQYTVVINWAGWQCAHQSSYSSPVNIALSPQQSCQWVTTVLALIIGTGKIIVIKVVA